MKLRNQSCQLILGHYTRTLHQIRLFLQIVDLFLSFSKLGTFFLYFEKKIPSLGNKIPSFGIDNFISGVYYLMVLRGFLALCRLLLHRGR